MAIGDVIRMTLNANDPYRYIDTVLHYAQDVTGSGSTNYDTWCSDWWTAWSASILAAAVNSVSYNTVSCQVILGPSVGNVGVSGSPAGAMGTYGAADVPREICICITKKIIMAGRKYRGRMFWGPTGAGHFSDVATGAVNVADASLVALSTVLTSTFTSQGTDWYPCLVHASHKPVVYTRTPGIITESVVSPGAAHRKSRRDKAYNV